jgi:hypothetical protein
MSGPSLIYSGREAAAQDKGGKNICQKIPGKGLEEKAHTKQNNNNNNKLVKS